MRNFEYARPATEADAVSLLSEHDGQTAVLAGGTDLFNLLRRDLVAPLRVVDIKDIPAYRQVVESADGVLIGAAVTLDEVAASPLLSGQHALRDVLDEIQAIQVRASGTLAGDLCLQPRCWYYRSGFGLLARQDGESLVETGRNEHHAIFGNRGPAKFVSASRFAPALIAAGAKVRIAGPGADEATFLPLESFFVTPRSEGQGVTALKPGQLVTHVWLPRAGGAISAGYEVAQSTGLDVPMAAAAVSLTLAAGGAIRSARVVLGQVAPVPWVSHDAAEALVGKTPSDELAAHAADVAVSRATPLSENEYKVQVARAAVKRAIVRAVERAVQREGGLA
jgi:xanthine dehydrogenase YagS FAD-binding subunit